MCIYNTNLIYVLCLCIRYKHSTWQYIMLLDISDLCDEDSWLLFMLLGCCILQPSGTCLVQLSAYATFISLLYCCIQKVLLYFSFICFCIAYIILFYSFASRVLGPLACHVNNQVGVEKAPLLRHVAQKTVLHKVLKFCVVLNVREGPTGNVSEQIKSFLIKLN